MRLEHWFYKLPLMLRSLIRRRKVEEELDEELQYHLEMKAEQLVARGMSQDEAWHAALRAMDGLEQRKEQCRDARSVRWLEELLRDTIYGIRMMVRSPVFTASAVITLALSIGANTAIFTLVNSILIRPLPFPDPERLACVKENSERIGLSPFAHAPEYAAWKRSANALSMAAYDTSWANLTGRGEATRVSCGKVTESFFRVVGVQPAIGRNFVSEEDRPGGEPVVILSHDLWLRRFGGDHSVLGKTLILDARSYSIIGVMPARFQIPDRYNIRHDIWIPLSLNEAKPSFRTILRVIGRLKPGISLGQAESELDRISQPIFRNFDKAHVMLTNWHEDIGGELKRPLIVFLVAVGFVLLIACANIANLLLARATTRDMEVTIRRALGASRLRIIRQLLTESILVACLGGSLGLELAVWLKDFLVSCMAADFPSSAHVAVDARVFLFNAFLILITGVGFGLIPAIQATATSSVWLWEAARTRGRNRGGSGYRNSFIVLEIALALVLLIGAGLLVKSFLRLQGIDPGFRSDQILSMTVDLTPSKYPRDRDQSSFFQQLIERLRILSGAQSVGVNSCLPLAGTIMTITGLKIPDRSPEPNDLSSRVSSSIVSASYFPTVGIPLLKGRHFAESDKPGSPMVVIVSDSFARKYFAGEEPIGKEIMNPYQKGDRMKIIGVVADVLQWGKERETPPQIYFSYLQRGYSSMSIIVKTVGDPMKLAAAVRDQIAAIDKDQAAYDTKTLDERLSNSARKRRVNMFLLGTFAALALGLASIGIYGVVSYSVAQRTHEIGIRMALGAEKRDVRRMVLGRALTLTIMGTALGVAAALGMTRLISTLLFGVGPRDLMTFFLVPLFLMAVVLCASYLPAARAARIDPMAAIKYE